MGAGFGRRAGGRIQAWVAALLFLGAMLGGAVSSPLAAQDEKPPFPRRANAPGLGGGTEWLNTAGPLELKDLKGKFVVLDFWTFCCINCMHILPELKKLEHAYPDSIVVIGVHSPKFDGEESSANIREAILRYEIEHPVVNDQHRKIWDAYDVNSWPSLRVIDPEGKIVAAHGGEIEFEALDEFFKKAMPYYEKKKLLDRTPLHFNAEAYKARVDSPLLFPGKVLADEAGGRLFTADSNHNRVVVSTLDGKLLDVIGTGAIGKADGGYAQASFNKPQGMALQGKDVLWVADCENHLLRKVDLTTKQVTTVAGVGTQRRDQFWPGMKRDGVPPEQGAVPKFVGPPKETALNSPWALWIHDGKLFIAMAGPHQIWVMDLEGKEIGPYAGNGREDIVDGRRLPPFPYQEGFASFAQPSGLTSDGTTLFVADSEGSSVRTVPFDPAGKIGTLIGTADLPMNRLFTFGDKDGNKKTARLQHALDVAYLDGRIYVADTYNNKIKYIDLAHKTLHSFVGDGEGSLKDDPPRFNEPAGLSIAGGKLYVADTNNHAVRVISLRDQPTVQTLKIEGLAPPRLTPTELVAKTADADDKKVKELPLQNVKVGAAGVHARVAVKLPKGYKLNPLVPQTWKLRIDAGGDDKLAAVAGPAHRVSPPVETLELILPVDKSQGEATIFLQVQFFYCKEGKDGVCKVGSGAWKLPLKWGVDAPQDRLDFEVEAE